MQRVVMGLYLYLLQIHILRPYPQGLVNVTLFGCRSFAYDPVKMSSLGWARIQCDRIIIKTGTLETDK